MTKWIKAREMKTTEGNPVPIGEVTLFTSSQLHMFGDGYVGVGRLVKASQDSEVLAEYLRFNRALGDVYRSPTMDTIRREDYRELAERRMAHTLQDYDKDPTDCVFVYCRLDEDAMKLWKYMRSTIGRTNKYAIDHLDTVPERHIFIEAQAPTYLQGELFAQSLEERLKQ